MLVQYVKRPDAFFGTSQALVHLLNNVNAAYMYVLMCMACWPAPIAVLGALRRCQSFMVAQPPWVQANVLTFIFMQN